MTESVYRHGLAQAPGADAGAVGRRWLGALRVRGGKARRHFSIQRAGIRELEQSRRELDLMWDGLGPTPGLSNQ